MILALNLLAPQKKKEHRRVQTLLLTHESVLFLFLIVTLGSILLFGARMMLETRFREVILEKTAGSAEVFRINRTIHAINQELTTLNKIRGNFIFWTPLAQQLLQATPLGITYRSLTVRSDGSLNLQGHAKTRTELLELKNLLEKIPAIIVVNLPLQYVVEDQDLDFVMHATLDPRRIVPEL